MLSKASNASPDYSTLEILETYLTNLGDPHTKLLFKENYSSMLPYNFIFNQGRLYLQHNGELKNVKSINNFSVHHILIQYRVNLFILNQTRLDGLKRNPFLFLLHTISNKGGDKDSIHDPYG